MTECNQETFAFTAHFSLRRVRRFYRRPGVQRWRAAVARGGLQINLLSRLADCFLDGRDPERVEHTVEQMLSQRIYGLALGYEVERP